MFKKAAAATLLAATALTATAPALADGYRHGVPQKRFVMEHPHARYYHAHRRVYAHRPVVVQRAAVVRRPVVVQQPVVVHRHSGDVLGGLIVGAVLGAVIASQAGY